MNEEKADRGLHLEVKRLILGNSLIFMLIGVIITSNFDLVNHD